MKWNVNVDGGFISVAKVMVLSDLLDGEPSSHVLWMLGMLWEQWSICGHCSGSSCWPQVDLSLQPSLLLAEGMAQLALGLGLESDSCHCAQMVLSKAGAVMTGEGEGLGCLVALVCRKDLKEPAAKSCPWLQGGVGSVGVVMDPALPEA